MRKKRRIFDFEYDSYLGRYVPILKNKYGEKIAYQIFNEKTRKKELLRIKHD
jgi:hypothetical protein